MEAILGHFRGRSVGVPLGLHTNVFEKLVWGPPVRYVCVAVHLVGFGTAVMEPSWRLSWSHLGSHHGAVSELFLSLIKCRDCVFLVFLHIHGIPANAWPVVWVPASLKSTISKLFLLPLASSRENGTGRQRLAGCVGARKLKNDDF